MGLLVKCVLWVNYVSVLKYIEYLKSEFVKADMFNKTLTYLLSYLVP